VAARRGVLDHDRGSRRADDMGRNQVAGLGLELGGAVVMDAGIATVIGATVAALGGIAAGIISLLNHQKLIELHLTLNSRLDDFFRANAEALRTIAATNQAIGRADQIRDNKAQDAAGQPPPSR